MTATMDHNADTGTARPRAGLRLIAAVLLAAAAGAVWWLVFSPQARVKRNIKAMAAAFEARDADGILEHFSPNYNDAAGNTYHDMDLALRDFILPLVEEAKIDIQDIRVQVDRGMATAHVRGVILYKIKGVPRREKFEEENPAVLVFDRENGAWRVVSLENISGNMADLQESFENLNGVF
jgi:ketosteroid isomerase-like protein